MTIPEAIVAIPLWVAAGAFVAVIVVRFIRDVVRPSDPESPYDV